MMSSVSSSSQFYPLTRDRDPDVVDFCKKYAKSPDEIEKIDFSAFVFPDVKLSRRKANGDIEVFSTREELKDRKVVVFFVPGAWTPVCTKEHLKGYVAQADQLKNR